MSVPCHEGPPATKGHFSSEPAMAGHGRYYCSCVCNDCNYGYGDCCCGCTDRDVIAVIVVLAITRGLWWNKKLNFIILLYQTFSILIIFKADKKSIPSHVNLTMIYL